MEESWRVYYFFELILILSALFHLWWTEPGDRVAVDEPIAQIETDKVKLLIILSAMPKT